MQIEIEAMFIMPLIIFLARKGTLAIVAAGIFLLGLAYVFSDFGYLVCFLLGAWLAQFDFYWQPLEHPIMQWLGKISYPIYLSHWIVLVAIPTTSLYETRLVRVPVVFLVSILLYYTTEKFSIFLSKRFR